MSIEELALVLSGVAFATSGYCLLAIERMRRVGAHRRDLLLQERETMADLQAAVDTLNEAMADD
jgi:hypothetical protein